MQVEYCNCSLESVILLGMLLLLKTINPVLVLFLNILKNRLKNYIELIHPKK